jgi:hypothetical protein
MGGYLELDAVAAEHLELLGGPAQHHDVGEEIGHHLVLRSLVKHSLAHVSAAGLGQIELSHKNGND